MRIPLISAACVVFWCAGAIAAADTLTLRQAVETAMRDYPSLRISSEQTAAAAAGIRLARTAWLPKVDALASVNRATRNNIFGLTLPQSVVPSISGPVLGTNTGGSVWGSSVGFLVSWEPFDFGFRQANVDAASATRQRAEASIARSRLEIAALAADAYLTELAAEQTVRAAQAAVTRAEVLERSVAAVVNAGLRPGVDLSRAKAETSLARTQLIQAEQAVAVARAALSQFTNSNAATTPGPLLELPKEAELPSNAAAAHPIVLEQAAVLGEVKAKEHILDRSYFPKFNLQASSSARGTGANVNGTTGDWASGLGPNIQNWAVGFSATFSLMDLPSLRVKKEVELHRERGEEARRDQLVREIQSQRAKAKATLDGARRVVENLPVQMQAARDTETQASARYQSGLSTIAEVAEAQRLLAQTEIDEALAKLGVWRAMLAVAIAQGDIEPFLTKADVR